MKTIYYTIFDGHTERHDVVGIIDEQTIVVYEASKHRIRMETVDDVKILGIDATGLPLKNNLN